jgi:hypothetical protein
VIFIFNLIISLCLLISIFYFGRKQPGYNHIKDTISELAQTGSLNERMINYFVFFVVGLSLFLLGLYVYYTVSNPIAKAYSGLLCSVAIGYGVAAFFPCDPGCPLAGSTKQFIHNAGGFVEYVGGGYFMFQIPELQAIAPVVLGAGILMSFTFLFRWRGLVQRVAEIFLFISMTWTGLTFSRQILDLGFQY